MYEHIDNKVFSCFLFDTTHINDHFFSDRWFCSVWSKVFLIWKHCLIWSRPHAVISRSRHVLSGLFNTLEAFILCAIEDNTPSQTPQTQAKVGCVCYSTVQIGSQLGVKVNGSDLWNTDLQWAHLLWQAWHDNISVQKFFFFFLRNKKKLIFTWL